MRVFDEGGVVIQGSERLLIDPHRRKTVADKVFVSHAHSDHVSIGAKNPSPYYMSHPTHGFIEEKIPQKASAHKLHFNTHFRSGDEKVSLVNSGHILGSSQVVVEGEVKVCVTTDFKLQNSIVQEGAEIVPCDVLVMESTFGRKEYSFPPREVVYAEIGKWLSHAEKNNSLPVLAGYATGKSQELTKIVNEYSNLTPYVHDVIFEKNKIHDAFGKGLGEYVKIDHNLKDAELLILPESWCSSQLLHALSVSAGKSVTSAKFTGWGWKGGFDQTFALSDHADYPQLLEYVRQAEPKQVFTHHGFERELAQSISRELKVPARPLSEARQLALAVC